MARSYKIKPDQLEEVHIFVDTRGGGLRVLHDADLYRKITGKKEGDVPLFCFDASKHPDGLPEGVYKETAKFAPLTFAVSGEIDNESLKYDSSNADDVKIDLSKRTMLRIKYLLREWSLSDDDKTLTLTVYKRPDGRSELTREALHMINNEVQPQLIKGFMEAYDFSQRSSAAHSEEQAIDAVKDGSGGKIVPKN